MGGLWEDGNTSLFLPNVRLLGQDPALSEAAASRCGASLAGCAVGQPRQTNPPNVPPPLKSRLGTELELESLVYGTWLLIGKSVLMDKLCIYVYVNLMTNFVNIFR